MNIWFYAILSTLLVSIISLVGIIFIKISSEKLSKIIFLMVSFAVGIILGNSFLHLIPESFEHFSHSNTPSLLICCGIVLFFLTEQILHWHHHNINEKQIKPLGKINLLADGIHNFSDGILIAAAWMTSPQIGLTTTLAVCIHEIPQEIADYGILLHAGYTRKKALFWNLFSALSALVGTVLMLWLGTYFIELNKFIIPLAAGGFIYLAGSDLIPELHKNPSKKSILLQIFFILIGLALMYFIAGNAHAHLE